MSAPTSSTIRVAALSGLGDLCLAAGANYEAVLRQVNVDPAWLADAEHRIPFGQYIRLLDAAATATGDDLIGLHLGAMQSIQITGVLGYVLQSSPDVRTQLARTERFFSLHQSGATIAVRQSGGVADWVYTVLDPNVGLHRQDAEATVAIAVFQWRLLTGQPSWAPTSVHFEHPAPAGQRELERLFACPVVFSDAFDGVRFPSSFLDTSIRSADPGLHRILTRYAEDSLSRQADEVSLAQRIRRLVVASLPSGCPTIDAVADRLAMTPRTLQRRLGDDGLVYSQLVDDVRKELAAQYLHDPQLALTETAFLVGYGDLTAFHRAFRRWYQTTPMEFQRRARRAHGGPH